jgi:CRISPR-associated endonuclease/helicase Cas3
MTEFETYFKKLTSHTRPHPWQTELAAKNECVNQMIRIPTGLGKTQGVLGAWLWHRLAHARADWPLRLVWCLPMRVLVEQTKQEVREALR